MPRRIWRAGHFICVPLGDEIFSYGRVIGRHLIAFYDLRSSHKLAVEQIVGSQVLFVLWVTSIGCYEVLGYLPLEADLAGPHHFFMQDIFTGNLSITENGTLQIPASYEECEHLERVAAWSPEHVVERLQAHFDGRENRFSKTMSAKRMHQTP